MEKDALFNGLSSEDREEIRIICKKILKKVKEEEHKGSITCIFNYMGNLLIELRKPDLSPAMVGLRYTTNVVYSESAYNYAHVIMAFRVMEDLNEENLYKLIDEIKD